MYIPNRLQNKFGEIPMAQASMNVVPYTLIYVGFFSLCILFSPTESTFHHSGDSKALKDTN